MTNPKHTSSDLIARLRDRVVYDSRHYTPDPLLKEAADRIEAQVKEIEALRNENAKLWGWLDTASQKGVATHGYMKGKR